ncbi:MAG: carboxypeptidase regulatory-like domain-containing protein, partial [Vicinamibacterales bacterium]
LNAFAGFGTQRPNLVGDPHLPADERSPRRWFNTSAFAAAPQFTFGTSSRNPVRGPAYRNLDVAVIRRVPLGAMRVLEVRGEVFNLTNTPALGVPNGVFGSPAFGSITSAGDPRVIQLALKLVI